MKTEIFFGLLSIGFFILVLAFVFWAMSSYPKMTVLSVSSLLLVGGYIDWKVQKRMREKLFVNKRKYFEL